MDSRKLLLLMSYVDVRNSRKGYIIMNFIDAYKALFNSIYIMFLSKSMKSSN